MTIESRCRPVFALSQLCSPLRSKTTFYWSPRALACFFFFFSFFLFLLWDDIQYRDMDRAIEVISTFTTNLSWSTFISPRALLVLMGGAFILIQNTTARLFTFVARVLFYEFLLLLLLRVLLCHARQTVRWGRWHQKGYSAVRLKISGSTSWTRF